MPGIGATAPTGRRAGHAERLARAHLSRVVEPGDGALATLLAEHGEVGLASRLHSGAVPDRWVVRARALTVPTVRLVDAATRGGIRIVVPGDPDWPAGLADLEHEGGAVACLWVRGRLGPGDASRAIAVVGSRDASPYGEGVASRLAADLVTAGRTVVSGAALGIDAAAHRGALSGAGAGDVAVPAGTAEATATPAAPVPTVAVLGCGVDRAYPAAHAPLLQRVVAAGGGVLAELPPGSSPYPWRFPARNRVIAALSCGVVVVEAGVRSGAVGTARAAEALSRVVMAVPGPAHASRSAGCHELLRTGAGLVTSVGDVLELTGPLDPGPGSAPGRDDAAGVPAGPGDGPSGAAAERVHRCLSRARGRAVDTLAAMTGLDPPDARAALLDLEIAGLAGRGADGWRRAAPARPRRPGV
jgi:DNA processing protein